jgi:hypothetical protein
LAVDLSDQSRFITADAALERNPVTTSATAGKQSSETPNRIESNQETRKGRRARTRGSLWGYDDASAGGANAPRRSVATSSAETAVALAPIGYRANPQFPSQESAVKVVPAAAGGFGSVGAGGGHLGEDKSKAESQIEEGGNHQESELFLRGERLKRRRAGEEETR